MSTFKNIQLIRGKLGMLGIIQQNWTRIFFLNLEYHSEKERHQLVDVHFLQFLLFLLRTSLKKSLSVTQ